MNHTLITTAKYAFSMI
jgi:hypothetical protein